MSKELLEKQKAEKAQDKNIVRRAYSGKKYKCTSWDIDTDGNPNAGKTIQSVKDECDIKNIIRKHDAGELILNTQKAAAQYGDFSELNEFQESMNIIAKATQSFAQIPSEIRKRFGNDAGAFHEFVTNPENQDQMVKMGLAVHTKEWEENKKAENKILRDAKIAAAAAAALPADAETAASN